jgi:uncharacterized protein YutD
LSGAHIAANSTAPSQERRFHNLLPKVEYKVGDWDDNTFGAELSDEEKTLRGFRWAERQRVVREGAAHRC